VPIFRGPTFAGLDDVFIQMMTGKLPAEKQTGSNAVVVKTKPVLFTEAQLRGQIAREYRPGEAAR
jgi:hypothetical protein